MVTKTNQLKYYLLVALTGILSGGIVFGGKVFSLLGLSLFEISFLPYLFGTIVIFLVLFFQKSLALKRSAILILVLYGLLTSLCVLGQFSAVVLGLPVAIAVLLLYTQPLWTILYCGVFQKEKITKIDILSCFLVLLGVFLLANPWGSFHITNWLGFVAGLVGGIGLSGWVITGSLASKVGNHPTNTFFWGGSFLIVFLLILFPIIKLFTTDPSIVSFSFALPLNLWIYIIIFSLLTTIIGHLSYFYGVRVVPTVDAGIILLLEPIVGTILAVVFLKQSVTISILIGGVIILLANYLVITKGARGEQTIVL